MIVRVVVFATDVLSEVYQVGTVLAPIGCDTRSEVLERLVMARDKWRTADPEPDCDTQFIDYLVRHCDFHYDIDKLVEFSMD